MTARGKVGDNLAFWQDWFHDRLRGRAAAMPDAAAVGWPAVEPGSWPALHERFLSTLDQLAAIGADSAETARPITPALEYPPLAHDTVGEALVHIATHNSHHLGQMVVLRQVLGAWPPPAGSLTW